MKYYDELVVIYHHWVINVKYHVDDFMQELDCIPNDERLDLVKMLR